jgi:leucyl aminopeptidase (aminopeptidase T)
MKKVEKGAFTIIHTCLNLEKEESCLILTDEPMMDKATLLFHAAAKRSKQVFCLQLPIRLIKQGQLPDSVGHFMAQCDVVIAVTSHSISHTKQRRQACKQGTRCASLPNITEKSLERIAKTDFDNVAHLSQKLRDILTIANEARITAPNGTHLVIPIRRRKGFADTGHIHDRGSFSNLPAGEASIAPEKGKTEGKLVVDSGMGVFGEDSQPLSMLIKEGRAARISGGVAATHLRRRLAAVGPDSRWIAELGIGTNSYARLCGVTLEDEKVMGTIHIALGNDISFGGSNDVPIHLDGVVHKASLSLDGRDILINGRWVLE